MVWIVGPIVAILVFFCFVIVCCVARRRKQHLKTPLHHEQAGQHAMTPLMAGYDMNGGNGVIVSGLDASAAGSAAALPSVDPVELRRLNFQVLKDEIQMLNAFAVVDFCHSGPTGLRLICSFV